MATLVSRTNGNLTSTSTWKNIATGSGSLQTTITSSQGSATSYGWSSAFTITNGEVIEGMALHLRAGDTTPTGTLTVGLSADNGTSAIREVTVNVSDLAYAPSWVYFEFGSTYTSDGGSDFKVGVKTSTNAEVVLWRDGTAGNWGRILTTDTSPGSVQADDSFYIVGEWTGAGAFSTFTVTMDSTSSTDYNSISIGDNGILQYGYSASTNYYLKLSGNLTVYGRGELDIGTVANPIPSTSTAVLELDPTSDGEFGLLINTGGKLVAQGASKTYAAYLNSDAAVNATSLTTDISTGWKDNDQIVVASTTKTAAQTEIGTMNGDASGTTLTVDGFGGTGGGVAYAHSGTTPTKAEIINLTRNVKIRSSSSTIMAYIKITATYNVDSPFTSVDCDYVEIYYMGENATGKYGVWFNCPVSFVNCSFHDFEDWGLHCPNNPISQSSPPSSDAEFKYSVMYKLNSAKATGTYSIQFVSSYFIRPVFDYVMLFSCGAASNQSAFSFAPSSGSYTNITVVSTDSTTNAIILCSDSGGSTTTKDGTLSNIVAHSNGAGGIIFTSAAKVKAKGSRTASSITAWRNNGYGISTNVMAFLHIVDSTSFGNSNGVYIGSGSQVLLDNVSIYSETSYTQASGLGLGFGSLVYLRDCQLGVSGSHTTADINTGGIGNNGSDVYMRDTTLGSTTEIYWSAGTSGTTIVSENHDGTSGLFKIFQPGGIATSQTTMRHTASGIAWTIENLFGSTYVFLFPSTSMDKLFRYRATANVSITVSAWVRRNSSYDGDIEPQLIVVGGRIDGIETDVIDSLTVGADTWEQLSCSVTPTQDGVVEFYIETFGSAGEVYVDDISVT